MQQHVGVAVADRLPVVRDVDAAQPQRPARREPMRVVSDSDAEVCRGTSLRERQPATDLTSGL